MAIESLAALEAAGKRRDLVEVIIDSDCQERGATREDSLTRMHVLYAAIRRAKEGYDPALRSRSGMVGGDGARMRAYVAAGKTICGDYIGQVIAQALEMGLLYMAFGIVCYCLLMGQSPRFSAYLADLGMGVAAGGLFGMILTARKNG